MDMSKYLDLFVSESREHLRSMNDLVVTLEREGGNKENIDSLFRSAHSVKGMAASMGYGDIAELAHKMEDLMDRVRKGTISFDAGAADLLLEGADCLDAMIGDVAEGRTEGRDIASLAERIAGYDPGHPPPAPSEKEPASLSLTDNRRAAPHKQEVSAQTVRVKTEILDHLVNATGELITNKNRLLEVGKEINSTRLNDALTELTKLLRELSNAVMTVRMMPFSSLSNRFPRMVRDLAKKSGKEVKLVIEGEGIEFDRGILEELADPLTHIIRNAIDHGLENTVERKEACKPAEGTVKLAAGREKDRMVITVEDDGRGMDPAKILAAAIEKGCIDKSKAAELSIRDTLLLTCIPGFSTAKEVTDVSGRGVGMDSVSSAIQSLSGSLDIESEPGRGSRIIINLPLTISIINVLIARVSRFCVAIPVTNISQTLDIRRSELTLKENRECLLLGDEYVPVSRLDNIFESPDMSGENEFISLFISEKGGQRMAFAVDRFLGQQEVFVKPLGRPLSRLRGMSGGAILGDGEIVFVLDVASLF